MSRVVLNGHQSMQLYSKPTDTFSDDEDGVQSGSATGFSDGDREEPLPQPRQMSFTKKFKTATDPVTQILDKIDAELSSLTRSQGSSSTATTATDSTVVHRPNNHTSLESSRGDNGDGLSLSQLGPSIHKPSYTPLSSLSRHTASTDRDTGIGTGPSSFRDDSLQQREPGPLQLEPGDGYKHSGQYMIRRASPVKHGRSVSAEMTFLNNRHPGGQSDDDKSKQEKENGFPSLEAKQVDDKFKEILQKRKGGGVFQNRAPVDDDSQTIRTEDFNDKFQDTLVYSSDGGTCSSPRFIGRSLDRPKKKLFSSLEGRHRKGNTGTPPVYPKPTPTNSLPRPSTRSSLKFTPGHTSDADSVRTEDFENQFKFEATDDLMVTGNQTESDLDTVSNDPIHTKVKQLLSATAKYGVSPHFNTSNTTSILKPRFPADKPKSEQRTKQHVRISKHPTQYQPPDKGDDSDDTLCSDKEDGVMSPRSMPSHHQTDDGVTETRLEIARESDRIRREMERERRAKSPVRDRSPTRTYLTVTASPKTLQSGLPHDKALNEPHGSRKSLSDEEKERTAELRATKNALEVTQTALLEARKSLKEVQAQYEDARTQIMLSEYKRESTTKELARLSDEMRRKQEEVKSLENQTRTRREEMQQFDAIGFTKEEAMQIISENETMKNRLRNLDAIHAERDELIQQLDSTKQELFQEQKKARTQIEELKEELENMTSSYEQYQTESDEAQKKIQKLETAYKKMEKEKNELIQEKTRQYQEEKDKHKLERVALQQRGNEETEGMRQELVRAVSKVASLQEDVRGKDELNKQLRDQIYDLQQRMDQEKTSHSIILEEHKKTLQTLRKETDSAMVQMRESLFLEKQKTVDIMRGELDQERREIASRTEERYEAQLKDQAAIIKAKTEEISYLAKLVDKLETEQTRTKVKYEEELKLKVQEAISREHKLMEQQRDASVQQEKDSLTAQHHYELKQLQDQINKTHDELGYVRNEKEGLQTKIKDLKNELDDIRTTNKAAMHEKLIAVARAKEQMRLEHQAELDRVREQLKNEHRKETDKLKDTIRQQENELRQLREERLKFVKQQKESSYSLDRTERTLINEINEECRKTSEVLGLSPRKVNINSYRANVQNTPASKSPTTAALANLRACNEELRYHVTDLQHDLEVQNNTLKLAAREKDEALANLRRQMEREKEEEMARLKERLVRGMSTNDHRGVMFPSNNETMSPPLYEAPPSTAERQMRQISEQQQQDLERLEQEINKLAMNSGQLSNTQPSQEDISYAKNLAVLQAKVKQLQNENNGLRKMRLTTASSTPDLSSPDLYGQNHRKFQLRSPSPTREQQRIASALELRLREHDYETATLTDHQRRNRDIMSRKMAEMTKLQNTLTNQAKELIQLEKSYTQLNQYAKSPRPRSSLH